MEIEISFQKSKSSFINPNLVLKIAFYKKRDFVLKITFYKNRDFVLKIAFYKKRDFVLKIAFYKNRDFVLKIVFYKKRDFVLKIEFYKNRDFVLKMSENKESPKEDEFWPDTIIAWRKCQVPVSLMINLCSRAPSSRRLSRLSFSTVLHCIEYAL